jgi:DNA repair exonuclease SbcCD ATPase subunit
MQLSASDRRSIIEDLLDIQIFSSMNVVVKEKISAIKDESNKNKYAIDLVSEKINMQKETVAENKKHNDREIENKNKEITNSIKQIDKLNNDIKLIQKHIDSLQSKIEDKLFTENRSKKLIQIESKIETNIKNIEKDIIFYENHDNCPTCKQTIADNFKQKQIKEKKGKVKVQQKGLTEISEEIIKSNARIEKINAYIKAISAHNNEIIKHNSTISAIHDFNAKLQQEIDALSSRKTTLESDNDKLKELNIELSDFKLRQEELSLEKQYYDLASSLLKDTGIKTKIIKQYLPIMNKLVNKYLTAMNFFVNFNINENFEETIKSRHRDDFSYANFSEGEKMRIDLALLFTWRQIAKMKNSTNTNLLILDEVFDSSLDLSGTDEFMKLLQELGKESNVFVISHKGDQLFDKFRSVIKFIKKNNFSQVEK